MTHQEGNYDRRLNARAVSAAEFGFVAFRSIDVVIMVSGTRNPFAFWQPTSGCVIFLNLSLLLDVRRLGQLIHSSQRSTTCRPRARIVAACSVPRQTHNAETWVDVANAVGVFPRLSTVDW
jgi:hypothetical protein